MANSNARLLAFSSSREGNSGYLQTTAPFMHDFLGDKELNIAFIPFASVNPDYEAYTENVRKGLEGLPYIIQTVTPENGFALLGKADVIMAGGGNTFKLLHDLYKTEFLGIIKAKVDAGIPYIGWSAGSNIAGATICTSNDMPIINPGSFEAFGFLPFQINPHYYNQIQPGFNGETRDQRLAEFLQLNPTVPIVALPEGTALQMEQGKLKFSGNKEGILFKLENNTPTQTVIAIGDDLSYLLDLNL